MKKLFLASLFLAFAIGAQAQSKTTPVKEVKPTPKSESPKTVEGRPVKPVEPKEEVKNDDKPKATHVEHGKGKGQQIGKGKKIKKAKGVKSADHKDQGLHNGDRPKEERKDAIEQKKATQQVGKSKGKTKE